MTERHASFAVLCCDDTATAAVRAPKLHVETTPRLGTQIDEVDYANPCV